MAKKRVGSEIGNLISNHKMSRIAPIYLHAGGVRHIVRKFTTRATTLLHRFVDKVLGPKVARVPSLGILGFPLGSPETK